MLSRRHSLQVGTNVADYLREIGPQAEKALVLLNLENTCSAADSARMVERERSIAVLVYSDTDRSANRGYDVGNEIRRLGRHGFCEFHRKDNPGFLGQGKIDIPAAVDATAGIGLRVGAPEDQRADRVGGERCGPDCRTREQGIG